MSQGAKRVNVGQLIERQARLWEMRRTRRQESADGVDLQEFTHLAQGPYLSISKEEGCDAEAIGRAVAERLGWVFYDRELIEEVARETHVREKVLSTLDERVVSQIDDFVGTMGLHEYVSQPVFVGHLIRVIMALGGHGKAVLMGRGANFLLDPAAGLRVRLIAPLDLRVTRFAERTGTDLAAARKQVFAIDRQRAAFVRHFLHADIADPRHYEIAANLEHLGRDDAVEMLVAALRRRFGLASS